MRTLFLSQYWLGFITAVGAWITSFLIPTAPFVALTLALVLCDLITGIRAAKKRKEAINSKGLRRTVEKFVLYFIAILLSEGMKNVLIPQAPVTYITTFAIAMTEFKSNIENIETVTGVNILSKLQSKIPGLKKD